MEHRAEPRFLVSSPIRVIVPGNPAQILNCDLIDVSATGMRFISSEKVPADEIVAVEVDSRLVLAEIRYCQPRGDKFVAGVRRLHEIAKGAELTDSGACATEMIGDLRRHISAGGERDSKTLAMKALEEIVGRGEVSSNGPTAAKVEVLTREPVQAPEPARAKTPEIAIPNVREPEEVRHQPIKAIPVEAIPIDAIPTDAAAIDVADVPVTPVPAAQGPSEIELHQPVPVYEMPLEAVEIDSARQQPVGTLTDEVLDGDVTDESELVVPVATGSPVIEHQEPVAAIPTNESPVEEPVAAIPAYESRVEEPAAAISIKESPVEQPVAAISIKESPVEQPVASIPINESRVEEPVAAIPITPIKESPVEDPFERLRAEVLGYEHPSVPVPAAPVANEPVEIKLPEPVVAEQPVLEPVAKAPVKVLIPAKPSNTEPIPVSTEAAAESVDPLNTARHAVHSSGNVSDSSARSSRSLRIPLGIAAGLVLAAAIAFNVVQRRTQAKSPDPAVAVDASKIAPAPVAAASTVPPAPIPATSPTPAQKPGVHHAQLKMVQASWVSLVVDGGKQSQTVFHKGDIHEFDFKEKAFLWIGNAPGVEVTLDDAPVGPLKGNVRLLLLTPHGVKFPNTPPSSVQ